MKPIITLTILGVALAAVLAAGPSLAAWARQKCLEMLEGASSPCASNRQTAGAGATRSAVSPAWQPPAPQQPVARVMHVHP